MAKMRLKRFGGMQVFFAGGGGGGTPTPSNDPDAQAYFDCAGDTPSYFQTAWDNVVTGLKTAGIYGNLVYALPWQPTRTKFGGVCDAVSASDLSTTYYQNDKLVNAAPLYLFPRFNAYACGGVSWSNGASSDGSLDTGYAANTIGATRTICSIWQDEDQLNSGFNYGAFQGGTTSSIMQKNTGSAKTVRADGYTNSTSTGRVDYTSTLDGIRNIVTIGTDLKVYENSVLKGTESGTSGSVPTTNYLINGYTTNTNNGGGANQTCGLWMLFDIELTPAQVATVDGLMSTFQTEAQRTGTYDFGVYMEGDSHTVYHNSQTMQNISYDLSGLAEIAYLQVGISGATFDSMLARQASVVYPRITDTISKIYFIVWEGTNQISGGTSAADSLTKLNTYCGNLKTEAANEGITLVTIVPTLLARDFIGEDAKILESGEYNTDLIGSTPANVDHVVQIASPYASYRDDFGSDAAFITDQRAKAADTAYFLDGTHLVDGANGYRAAVSKPISDLIKTLEGL